MLEELLALVATIPIPSSKNSPLFGSNCIWWHFNGYNGLRSVYGNSAKESDKRRYPSLINDDSVANSKDRKVWHGVSSSDGGEFELQVRLHYFRFDLSSGLGAGG